MKSEGVMMDLRFSWYLGLPCLSKSSMWTFHSPAAEALTSPSQKKEVIQGCSFAEDAKVK